VPLGINSHGYIAKTSQQARDDFFPSYAAMMNAIGRERGWSGITRGAFDSLTERRGALVVGPHANIMQSIELFGTQVAPQLRAALGTAATLQGQRGT
jgi:hypothetical protein